MSTRQSLGILISKGISTQEAVYYWIAQLLGGVVGAALIHLVLTVGKVKDQTGGGGTNNWGGTHCVANAGGAFFIEVILTFLLVLVVLLVTSAAAAPGFAGLAIGLVLTVIHLVGIPLDETSVNPRAVLRSRPVPGRLRAGPPVGVPLVGGACAARLAPLLKARVDTTESGKRRVDQTGANVSRSSRPKWSSL